MTLTIVLIVLILTAFYFGLMGKNVVMNGRIKNIIDELPKHSWKEYETRDPSSITGVVVHHSVSNGTPESYARYHVNKRGWAGIGYHFVIQKDGQIYQTQKLTTDSNHAKGVNYRTVGICLTGNFDKEKPTEAQIQSLIHTIKVVQSSLGRYLEITGHRDHKTTKCPGDNLNLTRIKQAVSAANVA